MGELREGMIEPSGSYPLGYSEDEAHRLATQAAFFEDLTGECSNVPALEWVCRFSIWAAGWETFHF